MNVFARIGLIALALMMLLSGCSLFRSAPPVPGPDSLPPTVTTLPPLDRCGKDVQADDICTEPADTPTETAETPADTAETTEAPTVVASRKPAPPKTVEPDGRLKIGSIMIVGDSLSVGIGTAMSRALKTDEVTVIQKGKISTGLNSPRYYNWEEKLDQFLMENQPDAIVVSIGGNDAFNGSGSEKWQTRFQEKTKRFLEIASSRGVLVYWAGLPTMQDPEFSRKVKVANAVMEEVCRADGNCHYVDTWNLTADDTDMYTTRKEIDGEEVCLRAGDGAHFTLTGYMIVARHILAAMSRQISLGH